MAMEMKPLSPALGIEVTGLDLTQELDDVTFAKLRQAWIENLVMVIRGQKISTEEQMHFAKRFGNLEEVRSKKDDPNQKQYVMWVSNRVVEGSKGALPDGEMYFHSDQCYFEAPCQLTMLNAVEIPSAGGETLFINLYKAYESLPEEIKARIGDREIYNQYDYESNATTRARDVKRDAPHHLHPMVTRHPDTGKPVLFVNRLMTHHIVGMDAAESERLLEMLFEHMEQPKFIYEHKWRQYDLLLWDNRAVLHARRDFDPAQARILRRVTVKGARPVPATTMLVSR